MPNQRSQHFMGAVVLSAHATLLGQANRYEVIDGQQRITTLYILLSALRDVADYRGVIVRSSREDVITHLLRNVRPHDDEKYDRKLVPTMAFLQQLNEIEILSDTNPLIRIRGCHPLKKKTGKEFKDASQMISCYLYFASVIEAFIGGKLTDADDETDVDGIDNMPPIDRFTLLRNTIFEGFQLVAHMVLKSLTFKLRGCVKGRGLSIS